MHVHRASTDNSWSHYRFLSLVYLRDRSSIRERSSIMSARLGRVGGLIKNADTADAGEGGGGVSDEMLTLLILGSGGVEKSWLRAEIKRK